MQVENYFGVLSMTDYVITKADIEAGKILLIEEYNIREGFREGRVPGTYSFFRDEKGRITSEQAEPVLEPSSRIGFTNNTKMLLTDADPQTLPPLGGPGLENK